LNFDETVIATPHTILGGSKFYVLALRTFKYLVVLVDEKEFDLAEYLVPIRPDDFGVYFGRPPYATFTHVPSPQLVSQP
jgi:hypothetical protein